MGKGWDGLVGRSISSFVSRDRGGESEDSLQNYKNELGVKLLLINN